MDHRAGTLRPGSYAGHLVVALRGAAEAAACGHRLAAPGEDTDAGTDALHQVRCRIDAALVDRLWEELLSGSESPLDLIESVCGRIGLFDFGGFPAAVVTARTRRESLNLLSRYVRLMSDLIELDYVLEHQVVLLRLRNTPALHWASQLLFVLLLLDFSRRLIRGPPVLHGALLNFPDGGLAEPLEARLGTNAIFNAHCTGLILEPRALDTPLPFYSETIHLAQRDLAERALETLESPLGLRVKDAIAALIDADEPVTADQVAARLQTSSRTLQRRLSRERRSLSSYLDQVRADKAKKLLITTQMPIGRVAQQVGFDYQASFNKFFARQAGMSPGRYRQAQGARSDAAAGD